LKESENEKGYVDTPHLRGNPLNMLSWLT